MNREQMVENAARAIFDQEHLHTDLTSAREDARAVLDAVLPQVSTVAELAALPWGTLLRREPDGYESPRVLTWKQSYYPGRSVGSLFYNDGMANAATVLAAGPLTVVWTPEASA